MDRIIYKLSFDYNYALADIVESRDNVNSLELTLESLNLLPNFKFNWLISDSNILPKCVIIMSELFGVIEEEAKTIIDIFPELKKNPITIGNLQYDILSNIPTYSNCLNIKKSKITRFSTGDIMEIISPVLLPNEYAPIFKLEEISSTYFCTNLFKDVIDTNKLTGLLFEECKVKSKSWF